MIRNPDPAELGAEIDWSPWYLTDEEDMGESAEQNKVIVLLLSILGQWGHEQGWDDTYIGADQFFAWVPEAPLVRISPDVYLLDDPPPPPFPRSWKTWEGHPAPRFAVEIVSGRDDHPAEWKKDYDESPAKYAQLGTQELVVFDPDAAAGRIANEDRVALQLYRRARDGAFIREHAHDGPVYSEQLGAWLVAHVEDGAARLRLARDKAGADLVLSEAEARDEERQRRLAAERAREEAERGRMEAESEVARLRSELERLRRS